MIRLVETVNPLRLQQLRRNIDGLEGYRQNRVVTYARKKLDGREYGRYYAKGPCLQIMSRKVRNALGDGILIDVDVVNCFFTIIQNVAQRKGIRHPHLSHFNSHREQELLLLSKQLGLSRDTCKELFASIPNVPCDFDPVRSFESKYQCVVPSAKWIQDLKEEIFAIREACLEEDPFYVKVAQVTQEAKNGTNVVGSAFTFYLTDIEVKILMVMKDNDVLKKHKIKPMVLMHDGIMYKTTQVSEEVIRELEKSVLRRTGQKVHLKCKEMEFDLDMIGGEEALYDDIGPSASQVSNAGSSPSLVYIKELLEYITDRGLVRVDRDIYEPDEQYPYKLNLFSHYDKYRTLRESFNQTLQPDLKDVFMSRNTEIIRHVTGYLDEMKDAIPHVTVDKHLIGFTNGVWNIKTLKFSESTDSFCRRFYEVPFQEQPTPTWDYLVGYQLPDPSTAEVFNGLLGRLFFEVKEMDHWEIFLCIYGPGGTGKSTLIDTIESMFTSEKVGTIDKDSSSDFSLEGMDTKECVLIPDAYENLPDRLDKKKLCGMVSGERLKINAKHRTHYEVTWTAPLLMACNKLPKYKDDGGDYYRRAGFVPFCKMPARGSQICRPALKAEVPYVFIKLVTSYHNLLQKHKQSNSHYFWEHIAPECMKISRNNNEEDTNDIQMFLNEPPALNNLSFSLGALTPIEDFKAALQTYLGRKRKWDIVCDNATLEKMGYEIKRTNLCRNCNQEAKTGCCPSYKRENRYRKTVIVNMRFT